MVTLVIMKADGLSRLYHVPISAIKGTRNLVSGLVRGTLSSFILPSEIVRDPRWLSTRIDNAYNTGRAFGYVMAPTVVTIATLNGTLYDVMYTETGLVRPELVHPEGLIPLGALIGTNVISFLYEHYVRGRIC